MPRNATLGSTPCTKHCIMTNRILTFIDPLPQRNFMCKIVGDATIKYNSKQIALIVSMSNSMFNRHYYRNPVKFVFLHLLICLNSVGLMD